MPSLADTIALLQRNWAQMRTAPGAFAVCVLIGAGLAWLAFSAIYAERIETLKARLDAKDDTLKTKDDLIAEYRQRLGRAALKDASPS